MQKTFSQGVFFALYCLTWACSSGLYAQSDCGAIAYVRRIGSTSGIERGLSLAYSPIEDVVYIAGFKDDSVSILRMNREDEIEWIRTFDIVPGRPDNARKIIIDSEGMIVVSGVAGPFNTLGEVFAFRYNPISDQIIWSGRYLSYSNCFNHGLEELAPGDHFLMSNNPTVPGNNDAQLIWLNRLTGEIMPQFSLHYDLGDSDALNDIVLHEGFLYANGRYTDGPGFSEMRNTITKIDPATGVPLWTLLGHVPGAVGARLYGAGMVMDHDELFSISVGDENGTSINLTDIWLQKTNLDGEVQWIKKYDLPGTNDWVDEIISTEGGFILLARNRQPPGEIYLFKVDRNGNLQWTSKFDLSQEGGSLISAGAQGGLCQVGDHIYFTAISMINGDEDMILVKTDLQGQVNDTCEVVSTADINVSVVNHLDFYKVQPVLFSYQPDEIFGTPHPRSGILPDMNDICLTYVVILHEEDKMICQGSQYEGYYMQGIYTDTFTTQQGCDSIRILQLDVADVLQTFQEVEICPGQEYEGYTQSGIYADTFSTASGCDSVRTLTLSFVLPEVFADQEICAGGQYEEYTDPGMYVDTLYGQDGSCDTIRYLTLTVAPPIQSSVSETICDGEAYFGYTTPGLYTDTLATNLGCDSIRTVSLHVAFPSESVIQADLCEAYAFGYTEAGVYSDTLVSHEGCDSIRTLIIRDGVFYIPNVFSPNDDGLNDLFEIISYPVDALTLTYFVIYDRFGNMAYESFTNPVQWNGTGKNGKSYNPGVYTYLMKYTCDGEDQVITGDVTLIR